VEKKLDKCAMGMSEEPVTGGVTGTSNDTVMNIMMH
jgi:hypothetical protein